MVVEGEAAIGLHSVLSTVLRRNCGPAMHLMRPQTLHDVLGS